MTRWLSPAAAYDVSCLLNITEIHAILTESLNAEGHDEWMSESAPRLSYLGSGDTFRIDKEHYSDRSTETTILSGVGSLHQAGGETIMHIEYNYDIGMFGLFLKTIAVAGFICLALVLGDTFLRFTSPGSHLFGVLVSAVIIAIPITIFAFLRFEISQLHQLLVNTLRNS